MTPESLRTAIAEAKRFLKVANKAKGDLVPNVYHPKEKVFGSQSDTAAAKRASMDLTKALAAMRKSS